MPYFQVEWNADEQKINLGYTIKDIDFIMVPLYNRVHQEYSVLYEKVIKYLKTDNLNIGQDAVFRIYQASANSLKRETKKDCLMNQFLKNLILRLEMPKLVWCVEISSKEEYKERKVSARIIIDSTASPGEAAPWLLVHDKEKVKFIDSGKWNESKHTIDAYNMYQHNLKVVK